jgi:PAT family beta-lactamase induction signal transducer AmpG
MTARPETATPATTPTFLEATAVYFKPRVLIVLFLGFSAGLPLALSGSTLLFWAAEVGVNLKTIGLFALVGTPYTIKFLWAPLVDALDVPILARLLGRRRAWLLLTQLLLMAAILFLGANDPASAPAVVALGALMVATASATQDIVIDAFRIESLNENEQAAGMASYVAAYRVGMLASSAGALYVVSGFEAFGFSKSGAWSAGYAVMAALVLIGMLTTLIATEPDKSEKAEAAHTGESPLRRLKRTISGAFVDFFQYDGVLVAIVVLVFVVLSSSPTRSPA